jgi:hypothetical protein
MKRKPKLLGDLGIMEQFRFPGRKTIYRTIDHGVKNWTALTKRWCLNMRTLKSEYLFCKEKVFPVEQKY